MLRFLRNEHRLLRLGLSVTSSNKHIFIRLRSFDHLLVNVKLSVLALHATFPVLLFFDRVKVVATFTSRVAL